MTGVGGRTGPYTGSNDRSPVCHYSAFEWHEGRCLVVFGHYSQPRGRSNTPANSQVSGDGERS